MLTYRNTRTGAVVTVPCEVKGEWELIESADAKAADEVPEKKPEKKPTARKRTAKK